MTASSVHSEARCQVTIVFSDLSGSTELSSRLEPEEYAGLLDRIRAAMIAAIDRHGGSLVRIDGDGFLYIFGYPAAQEDATRRAIETALELHATVPGLAGGLFLHTGIHSGVVIVRAGDLSRGRYEILGEPTNVTARLCDHAGPGEILISTETLGADRRLFEAGPPEPLTLKASRGSVMVQTVTGRRLPGPGSPLRIPEAPTPFIGRSADLDWLQDILGRRAEAATIAVIQGEAGLGKTRLVFEFLKRASDAGAETHWGYCEAYLGAAPLQPVRQAALSILDRAAGAAPGRARPELARLNTVLEAASVSVSETEIADLASGFADVLAASPQSQPYVLFFDDWHWADAASRAFLSHLSRLPLPGVILILATRQFDPYFAELQTAEVRRLEPLSPEETKWFIGEIAPSLDPFLAQRIQSHSGGNPLYTEELCHAAGHGERPFLLDRNDTSLRASVNARYLRLPADLSAIVRMAAVIGHMVPLDLLAGALGTELAAPTLEGLRSADFLYPCETPGFLRFKHGLTREAVYALIGLAERQACHARIAEALASASEHPDHGALAYHMMQSGHPAKAVTHALEAGSAALAASALDRAQVHFELALDAIAKGTDPDPRTSDILRKYVLACMIDPGWEQVRVLQTGTAIMTRYQDTAGLALSQFWLGSMLYGLGEPRRALEQFEVSLAAAREKSDEFLVNQLGASIGQAHAAACDYRQAFLHLDAAIEDRRRRRKPGAPSVSLAYVLSCKAFALADQGAFEDACVLFDEAIEIMAPVQHEVCLSILGHRSAAHLWHGRFEDTVRISGQVLDMAGQMRSRYHYAMSQALSGAAEFFLSGDVAALDRVERVAEWMVAGGSQQYVSLNYGYLADGHARLGNSEKAVRFATLALRRARKGDRLGEAFAWRALAMLAAAGALQKPVDHYLKRAGQAGARRGSVREEALTRALAARLAGGAASQSHAPEGFYGASARLVLRPFLPV
ncbi:MAG: AAA family ATPase [Hyphomonas sp.]|uniref:ATP-binding protein n=1 Tax=Hyphomonas sp. TaxID=87 RepID=UPI00182C2A09|nr:adenylate/guanylate cyclase domain-containing protein [Hyphomonas sp.]MBA3069158.1 AAA family ATPase [Hyphomonas sp.]MBU3920187.1 AAA family ATPase [Alphaproteobacteria bacterium]MBU4062343.1 AAA family ATPase [Alphaproteobacteria bacterium]MBU4162725.1 AAA family ATPase [Alphaproteobacteria bacterium]